MRKRLASFASVTLARELQSKSGGQQQEDAVDRRWAVEKRREMRTVIIYSIVGLIIVIALVTFMSYAGLR
jgi:hypothetical protein